MRALVISFLLTALAIGSSASAASITHTTLDGTAGVEAIAIRGEIQESDEQTFRSLSIRYPKAIIALDSPGGKLLPAIEIGKMIHLQGYFTVVMGGSTCTSSCALIWIAGAKRFLSPSGQLGFHASYMTNNGKTEETGVGNALVGHYLSLLNLPERAVVFATVASPDKIQWLNSSTMQESGIDFEPFQDQPARASAPVASTQMQASTGGWRVTAYGVVANGEGAVFFVNSDSIKRDGDQIAFWLETRSKKTVSGVNRYMDLVQADCTLASFKYVSQALYLDDNLVSTSGASELQYALPETFMGNTIRGACEGKYFTGAVADRASLAARVFSRK